MNPSNQIQLYGLNKYFNEIKKLYDSGKMPNKILYSGKKGVGKSTLAYHIINYVLSQSEKDKYNVNNFTINKNNRTFILLNNKTHPNFYLMKRKILKSIKFAKWLNTAINQPLMTIQDLF